MRSAELHLPVLLLVLSCCVPLQVARARHSHHSLQPATQQQIYATHCTLYGNIIATKRQLHSCGFSTVLVVGSEEHDWQTDSKRKEMFSVGRVDIAGCPFPVVVCMTLTTGNATARTRAYVHGLGDDAPPCVRPALGREDIAFSAFILQNYDALPAHMFFVHGHELSWHQVSGRCCASPPPLPRSSSSSSWTTDDYSFGAHRER